MAEAPPVPAYFRYWGKARPLVKDTASKMDPALTGPRFHLLAFHSLDVAACGAALIRLPQFSLAPLAFALGWTQDQVERLFVFFIALHDLGKFARAFQGLARDLSATLVPVDRSPPYMTRHDTLGWFLWQSINDEVPDRILPHPWHGFWAVWIRAVVGHHGMPPDESSNVQMDGGDPAVPHCRPGDREAALQYIDELTWLLPEPLPAPPSDEQVEVLRRFSWQLAGLAVLADWLGSNQQFFHYQDQPLALESYWREVATTVAPVVIEGAGLTPQPVREWTNPLGLFDYLRANTVTAVGGRSTFAGRAPALSARGRDRLGQDRGRADPGATPDAGGVGTWPLFRAAIDGNREPDVSSRRAGLSAVVRCRSDAVIDAGPWRTWPRRRIQGERAAGPCPAV